ncbi:Imm52 family immunity protein [Lapillicoccus sp.]|uniref:Imm52 family immunity protein n=1 Tax=Lapillicoccus sp. TaxID=1909287 RepID=UPI003262FF36
MAEPYTLGAYWGPRASSADENAARLAGFLGDVADTGPMLSGWRPKADSRSVSAVTVEADQADQADQASLSQLLKAGRNRRDVGGEVVEELGYAEALYAAPVPDRLMTALVEVWDPDWCTWISSRLRRAQQVRPGKAQVGWLTWVHADLSDLGGPAGVQPLAAGSLLRLGDSPGAVATDDVSAPATLLGAGRNT